MVKTKLFLMKVAFCEWNPASVELNNQLLTTILFNFPFFSKLFFVYEHKCHFRIFSSKDVDFTLRFPGIIKKHAAGRRTFSVASHLKTRIHIILHCKTFIPITYMTISFTSACRARAPFDRCFVNNILASWLDYDHRTKPAMRRAINV